MAIESVTIASLFELQARADVFEDIVCGLYTEVLRRGDTALDGGAHRGRHTFPMAECVGASGMVHAFEVIPDLVDEMRKQVTRKRLRHIIVHDEALSDHVARAEFHWVKNRPGLSGLKPRDYGDLVPEIELIEVPTTTIDSISADQLRPWRFCKLDLEGAEFPALRGARKSLSLYHPVIVFENSREAACRTYGYTKEDWFSLFDDLDYAVYDLFGRRFTPSEWLVEQEMPWYFICVHRGSRDQDLIEGRMAAIMEQAIGHAHTRLSAPPRKRLLDRFWPRSGS